MTLFAAAAAVVTLLALVLQGAALVRTAPAPATIPVEFRAGTRSIWLFVRPGCRHCRRHLDALDRSASQLDPASRAAALARVHFIGAPAEAPAEVTVLPETLQRRLGVRYCPTTWLVDCRGRILARWLGARDSTAWMRAFAFVTEEGS